MTTPENAKGTKEFFNHGGHGWHGENESTKSTEGAKGGRTGPPDPPSLLGEEFSRRDAEAQGWGVGGAAER